MDNIEFSKKFKSMLAGSKDDFDLVYREMKKPVFTVIYRITGNWYDSEEILQDLFLRLLRLAPETKISNPRAYIFTMARNMSIDKLKSNKHDSEYIEGEYSEEDEDYEDNNNKFDKALIDKAFDMLEPSQKEILTLRLNGNLKFKDIAKMVNLPLGTVLGRYSKGIKNLKTIIERNLKR